MAIETYQHSVLRDDVLEEFGKDTTDAALKAKATRKLNDAIAHIGGSKPDWPWRLEEQDTAVSAGTAVTGDVTQSSTSVANVTPNQGADLRRYWVDGSVAAPGTVGYLISLVAGGTYTLASQYLGNTETGKAATIMDGLFALPSDFEKMQHVKLIGTLADAKIDYRSPLDFEEIRRRGNLVGVNNYVYTVKQDPLRTDAGQYLYVYPYFSSIHTIHYTYRRTIPKLDLDGDIPIIPIEDRLVVLKTAYWFFASYLKEDVDRVNMYKSDALEALSRMMEGYELGNEPDIPETHDLDTDFIRMPSGYPDIRQIS